MTALRDFSTMYTTIFSLVLFLFLFESRYSRKKTLSLTIPIMGPLMLANFVLMLFVGPVKMGTLVLITCSLPSLIFFWFLAKYRDGRFFFSFCLGDTLVMELLYLTKVLDYLLAANDWFLVPARLIGCPLLALFVFKYLRPVLLKLQDKVHSGWYSFTGVTLIFYVLLTLAATTPTLVTDRPEYLPQFMLLIALIPLVYCYIFYTLHKQLQFTEIAERDHILQLQVANMEQRMGEYIAADEKFRLERHDFRHKLQTIAGLAESGNTQELLALLQEYGDDLRLTRVNRYCDHPILDAVLSTYLAEAEKQGIAVTTRLAFPDQLSVREGELATMLANAIENAINACKRQTSGPRFVEVKVLDDPRFMIRIKNSHTDKIRFNADGLPVRSKGEQGLGTRSIAAFCEKNRAEYEFKATDTDFTLQILFKPTK